MEHTWGTFRFNVFIFGGILWTVIFAFLYYFIAGMPYVTGGAFSTYYVNLSIFLAFAITYPEEQVYLYFLVPVKMKWLAAVYAVFAVGGAIQTNWSGRMAILATLVNFVIFYLMTRRSCSGIYRSKRQKDFKKKIVITPTHQTKDGKIARHKCAVCGRTELDDPNLEFRFCSKCNGNYEYCQDHLFTHTHK